MRIRPIVVWLLCIAAVAAAPPTPAAQGWRTTALASFDDVWQTINDTFPDPTFGGIDWNAARNELRPAVQSAETPEAARGVIRNLLARLKRSHYVLLSASAAPADGPMGDAVVPIDIRISRGEVIVTRVSKGSTAEQAGVRAGATIVGIDQHVMAQWIAAAQGADERERAVDVWRRVSRVLHGPEGSVATLRLRMPSGEASEVRATRVPSTGQVVRLGNLPPLNVITDVHESLTPGGRRVGVIEFNYWMTSINDTVETAVDRFRKSQGLILDLRGNPGGLALLMSRVAGHVMDSEAVLGRMRTRDRWEEPLTFKVSPQRVTTDGRRVAPFAGPVAILIDELTASTSECFAGGLQSLGRARVFGRTSAGQALPASTKELANGDVLMYAIGDFVTSTGQTLEGRGVVPDEAQPLDPVALAAGRDTALEAALRWMDKEKR